MIGNGQRAIFVSSNFLFVCTNQHHHQSWLMTKWLSEPSTQLRYLELEAWTQNERQTQSNSTRKTHRPQLKRRSSHLKKKVSLLWPKAKAKTIVIKTVPIAPQGCIEEYTIYIFSTGPADDMWLQCKLYFHIPCNSI